MTGSLRIECSQLLMNNIRILLFLAGTSSMTSKLTGEGDADADAVPKSTLQFSAINSDF